MGSPTPTSTPRVSPTSAVADIEVARAWYLSRKLTWGVIVPAGSRGPTGDTF